MNTSETITDQERRIVLRNHENYKHLVIHIKDLRSNPQAVYCGRKIQDFKESIFHNPIRLANKDNEEERIICVALHRRYMIRRMLLDTIYKDKIMQLAGLKLACWCSPKLCHCSTLAAAADHLSKEDT